jgi:hypothetical protein
MARRRHTEIHTLLGRGLTITEISRTLRLERKTVRRYATATTAGQLIGGTRLSGPGLLGPHQAYLRQRWDEGARSTSRLHAELRERGYQGSLRTLRRLTAQLRRDTAVPTPPPPPAARKVASWIITPPGKLTDDDRAALAQITARCAELTITRDLVRDFADMLCNLHGEHLEAWASRAETSPVSELRGFSKGLHKDWAAVTAGLTTPYSSGAVEGHVKLLRCSKDRCTAGPNPTCSANASCSPTDRHGKWARASFSWPSSGECFGAQEPWVNRSSTPCQNDRRCAYTVKTFIWPSFPRRTAGQRPDPAPRWRTGVSGQVAAEMAGPARRGRLRGSGESCRYSHESW